VLPGKRWFWGARFGWVLAVQHFFLFSRSVVCLIVSDFVLPARKSGGNTCRALPRI
jgi:hypothetical protein